MPRKIAVLTPDFNDSHWHFDKRLSVNTFVSIIGMAVVVGGPVFVWGKAMDSRVTALEIEQQERSKIESKTDADSREQRLSLISHMDKIDDKVSAMQVQVGQLVVQLGQKTR